MATKAAGPPKKKSASKPKQRLSEIEKLQRALKVANRNIRAENNALGLPSPVQRGPNLILIYPDGREVIKATGLPYKRKKAPSKPIRLDALRK